MLRDDWGGIATLTLNRVPQRNSLSQALMAGLADELSLIETDADVRAVVIAANGPVFLRGTISRR